MRSKKMNTRVKIIILILIILSIGVFLYFKKDNFNISTEINTTSDSLVEDDNEIKEFGFKDGGLNTNTIKTSIPLEKILDGGPGKDGIPALTNPKFVSIKEAEKDIAPDIDGMVVSVGDTNKFYPFSIMVWHEIVNDVVNGKPLVITFCPLCGSSIAFEAEVDGKIEQFGVSGKLYESNLLMYDKSTESLWSQSIGTAVVGDRTGEKLTIYNSQLMSFKDFSVKWPSGKVLSTDTGYSRNYDF